MTQPVPKTEIFHARFRVMWPYWAGGYPGQQKAFEVYHEHQSDLQSQLAKTVLERLGSYFSVSDLSGKPFEPSGIELALIVEGPSSVEIDSSQIESVVRELGAVVKAFFQVHMPGAREGANAYVVDSEFWPQRGSLKKVGLPEDASIAVRPFESSQMTTLNDREVEELLTALAKKHLRPYELASRGPDLRENVERLLSTLRFLRSVSDRPENAVLYRELGKEIEAAPARPIVNSLRDLGILDALDEAPRLLFANLRRPAIPSDDLDLFRRGGIEDPEAELTILLYRAREFALAGKIPSEVLQEAPEVLKKQGERMQMEQDDPAPLKKRKLFNGIGNLVTGLLTGGANGLLAAGSIVAPNPATAYLAVGSATMAVGAIFKGVGDLRGE